MGIDEFTRKLPKAELHVHIGGTIEPELALNLAWKNQINLPYNDSNALRAAMTFESLPEFLDFNDSLLEVLRHENDVYEVTMNYLRRAKQDGIKWVEVTVTPDTLKRYGLTADVTMDGVITALQDAAHFIGSTLIVAARRELGEEAALQLIKDTTPWHNKVAAFSLYGQCRTQETFQHYFAEAKARGFHLCAAVTDADEAAVNNLLDSKVERLEHVCDALLADEMLERLAALHVTVVGCPLSERGAGMWPAERKYPLRKFLQHKVNFVIGSGASGCFAGEAGRNYAALATELNLTEAEITQLVRNSVSGSFMPEIYKKQMNCGIDWFAEN